MLDEHEQIVHDDPRTYHLYIVQNSLRILKNSEKEAQCHLLPKLSSGVRKLKINKTPTNNTTLEAILKPNFSADLAVTPPTRGVCFRGTPGESILGLSL